MVGCCDVHYMEVQKQLSAAVLQCTRVYSIPELFSYFGQKVICFLKSKVTFGLASARQQVFMGIKTQIKRPNFDNYDGAFLQILKI